MPLGDQGLAYMGSNKPGSAGNKSAQSITPMSHDRQPVMDGGCLDIRWKFLLSIV